MSVLTIGIWDFQGNSAHRKIRKNLLGITGVVICPGLSNRCTFGLANQQYESYNPATELEIIRFRPLPSRDLVWHLSTKLNNGIIAAWISVSDLKRGKHKRFIPFLIYALLYPSISSNLVNLATLIPWFDSVCMYTYFPFLRNPLLMWHMMVKPGY